MSWLDGVKHRIRTVLNPAEYDRGLEDEMRMHEDLDTMQQRDAQRARRRFGNRTYYKEETRRLTWLGSLDVLRQDVSYAWRSLSRTPGFAILLIVTLALGIGVNAATFTLLDRLYLRAPAGVARPAEIHRIWTHVFRAENPFWTPSTSYPEARRLAELWGDSSRFAVTITTFPAMRLGGKLTGPELDVRFATHNYFEVLGVRPQLGRFFGTDEDRFGSPTPVVVLSDHFWRTHLAADSGLLGRTIQLDQDKYVVVGIAPPKFTGIDIEPVDAWMPLASYPAPKWLKTPFWQGGQIAAFQSFARVAPGTDLRPFEQRGTQATREVYRGLWPEWPDSQRTIAVGSILRARGPDTPSQENLISTRLSAVALIVLLIAAANAMNLLLARATRRRREIAVRLALGISRGRLVRMITTETLILALLGAIAALFAARWGGAVLRSLLLPDVRWTDAALDARVIAFTLGVALIAGLVSGIVPAIQASKPQLTRALKDGERGGGDDTHRSRLRTMLVIAQAALSVVLLVGAALFVRSLRNVQHVDIGFDARRIVFGSVEFDPGQDAPSPLVTAGLTDLSASFRNREGVDAVALAAMPPMRGFSATAFFYDEKSSSALAENELKYPDVSLVSRDFFAATGLRMLRGSSFESEKSQQAVVNAAMAKELWPHVDPIGHCLYIEKRTDPCYTIVGIAETGRRDKIIEEPIPQFYLPIFNPPARFTGWHPSVIIARVADHHASAVMTAMTSALRNRFPTGYAKVKPMTENLESEYRPWRVGAALFTGFGALALIVAIVGIYSTVSYGVSQRTHEFGVRVALGARVKDVLQLVIGEGLRVVAIGVLLGVVLALAAGRLVAALLYGIAPSDPGVMLFVSATLLIVAALATLLPAWRAARVDPVTALRSE